AEVVVRTPDHDRAWAARGMPGRMGKSSGDALEIGEHAVAPFLLEAGKRSGKQMIIGHSAKISVPLCSTTETSDTGRIQRASAAHTIGAVSPATISAFGVPRSTIRQVMFCRQVRLAEARPGRHRDLDRQVAASRSSLTAPDTRFIFATSRVVTSGLAI